MITAPEKKPGFTLIEVAVSATLLALVLLSCFKLVSGSLVYTKDSGQKTQAYYLASQGIEVVKFIKNDSSSPTRYTELILDKRYHPYFNTITKIWTLIPGEEENTVDGASFHRQIVVSDDSSHSAKKITSTVWWGKDSNDNKKLIDLLVYLKD